jgi:hypothetical protein
MGFGLVNRFIDHLYGQLKTTSTNTYNAITVSHFTNCYTRSLLQPAVSSLVMLGNSSQHWRFFSFCAYIVTVRWISHNPTVHWAVAPSLLSLPCRTQPIHSELLKTGSLLPISLSWRQAPWASQPVIFFSNWTLAVSPYVTSSLTRWWVCCLQMLLVLTSTVILMSEFHGAHDHILLSQIQDSRNREGQVPIFISPRNRVAQL